MWHEIPRLKRGMTVYNMLKSLYLSFYSKDLYRDVAQNWRGLAFTYLFMLVFIYIAPLTLLMSQEFRAFVDTGGQKIIAQMPVMTFKNHKLSITEKQPHYVYLDGVYYKDSTKPKPTIIFDNTGAHQFNNLYDDQILVTEEFIHIRDRNGQIKTHDFTIVPDMVIDRAYMRETAASAKRWVMPVLFTFGLLGLFVFRILQTLVYGLAGLFLNKVMNAYLEYPQLVRIAVMAMTPVTLLDLAFIFLGTGGLGAWPRFFIAMAYLVFGIRANKELIS